MRRIALVSALAALCVAAPSAGAFGPVGEAKKLTSTGTNAFADVAYNATANEYLVVWDAEQSYPPFLGAEREILAQRVSASGELVGGVIRVSDMGPDGNGNFQASSPTVAYSAADDQYLIVWQGDDSTGGLVNNELEIFGQRLTGAGVEGGANDFRISEMGGTGSDAYDGFAAAVAHDPEANEFLVVWNGDDFGGSLVDEEFEIFGQRLDRTGLEVGVDDFRVSDLGANGDPSFGAFGTAAAYNPDDDEYLVVWFGDTNVAPLVNDENEVFGQRLTSAGTQAGTNDFRISSAGPDGSTAYRASSASVAYNAETSEYLVAWGGTDDAGDLVMNEFEVFGQRLGGSGAQVGPDDFRISEMGPAGDTDYAGVNPEIEVDPADGQYLVVWAGDDETAPSSVDDEEIYGQRLAGSSQIGADDFRISATGPDGNPQFGAFVPQLAYNSDDDEYFGTWTADNVVGGVSVSSEIFGRRIGGPDEFGAKTRVKLALAAKRIAPDGPLEVRVSNRNFFPVSGKLSAKRVKAKRFDLGASSRKAIELNLPSRFTRTLERKGSLRVTLTAKVEDPAGNVRKVRKTVRAKAK